MEPGAEYREFANRQGIETLAALEDLGDATFDVIALYYVLEHMRDPVAYLSGLR